MWSARSSVCSCRSACSCGSCSCDSPSTCSCVTSRYVQQSYQPQRSFRVSQQQRVHYERQERPQSARARSRPSPARALPQRQARPARRASVSGAAASAHVARRAATAGAKSRPRPRTRTRTRNSRAVSRSDGYTTSFGTTKPQYESKHCTKVVVVAGERYAVPYKTSSKPFRRSSSSASIYGNINPIVNSASSARFSETRQSFRRARKQTAGTRRKAVVPYKWNAARNRIQPKFTKPKRSNASQIKFGSANPIAQNSFPYRTVYTGLQRAGGSGPITNIRGYSNPGIAAERARWMHRHEL